MPTFDDSELRECMQRALDEARRLVAQSRLLVEHAKIQNAQVRRLVVHLDPTYPPSEE